jgi:hypothetical protein
MTACIHEPFLPIGHLVSRIRASNQKSRPEPRKSECVSLPPPRKTQAFGLDNFSVHMRRVIAALALELLPVRWSRLMACIVMVDDSTTFP